MNLHRYGLLLLLAACATEDGRTSLVVTVTGDEAMAAADSFAIFVDPTSPFLSDGGVELTEADDDCLGDWVVDDAALECKVNVPLKDGAFSTVELQPGSDNTPFNLSGAGWRDDVLTVGSDTYGPLSFEDGVVQHVELPFAPLENPIDGCHDEQDNDEDGWRDADDPDCATGTTEAAFGTNECNDGVDNDGDGTIDAEDSRCSDAAGTAEAGACEDGLDNDADGWSDD